MQYIDSRLKAALGSKGRSAVYFAMKEVVPKLLYAYNAADAYLYGKDTGDWVGALGRGIIVPYVSYLIVDEIFPLIFSRIGMKWVYGFKKVMWGGYMPYDAMGRYLPYRDFINWYLMQRSIDWGVGLGLNYFYNEYVDLRRINERIENDE